MNNEDHFIEFRQKHDFRKTASEPSCYSCKGVSSVDGHTFICLASANDEQYMKVFITTVCNNFSSA